MCAALLLLLVCANARQLAQQTGELHKLKLHEWSAPLLYAAFCEVHTGFVP